MTIFISCDGQKFSFLSVLKPLMFAGFEIRQFQIDLGFLFLLASVQKENIIMAIASDRIIY